MNAQRLADLRALGKAVRTIVEGTRCETCGGFTVSVNDAAYKQAPRLRRLQPACSCGWDNELTPADDIPDRSWVKDSNENDEADGVGLLTTDRCPPLVNVEHEPSGAISGVSMMGHSHGLKCARCQ